MKLRRFTGFRPLSILLMTIAVISCGGGEGPSYDGSLTLTETSLSFTATRNGSVPASQSVSYSSSNPEAFKIIIGVPTNQSKPSWLEYDFNGSQTFAVRIISTNMTPGIYTATVRAVSVRLDDSIIDLKDIPVTFVLDEAIVTTPGNVIFTHTVGELPANQSISITQDGNEVTPSSITKGPGGRFDAIIIGNLVEVTPNSSVLSLSPGTYFSDLRIVAKGNLITVPVQFKISARALSASVVNAFSINASSVSDDLFQDITIGQNFVGSPASWSAAIDVPWVSLSVASGDTDTNNILRVNLIESEIAKLRMKDNSGSMFTHRGTLTLSSSTPNVSSKSVTVTLSVDLPIVNFVSPNVSIPTTSDEKILRGSGFSGITNEILNCGLQAAISFTVISDTEIHAICPMLSVGSHEIELVNNLGINFDHAQIDVVNPVNYVEEVITSSGAKAEIIYETIRHAIYIANTSNNTVDRYSYNDAITVGSKWELARSPVINGLSEIAISTDGSYMYATSLDTGSRFYEIDLDTLNIVNSSQFGFVNNAGINSVAFINSGIAINTFNDGQNPVTAMVSKRNSAVSMVYPSMVNGIVQTSGDGSRALFASKNSNLASSLFYLDASDAPFIYPITTTDSGLVRNVSSITTDRSGSKWVLDNTAVYSNAFTLLGNLPTTSLVSILSHDGEFAFTVDSSGYLRKFQLSNFTEVGTGVSIPAMVGAGAKMTLSYDGNNIFIVDDQNLFVMSAP